MVTGFTAALILVIYFVVYYTFSEQDTILDAHECYYYSQMVESWGIPPDTLKVKNDLKNLKMIGAILKEGKIIWAYPKTFVPHDFISYSDSEYLGELHHINIPLAVSFGDIGELLGTVVSNNGYDFYLAIRIENPSDLLLRFIPASILTFVFMTILFIFIRRYLYPIQLMKNRILALESGDLRSQIPIHGDDELADLSRTINTLTRDIRKLLNKKQQLLSEVSHELRSPLARMILLIELMPDHKNLIRLKGEIHFLEGIISNLLLSDRLSMPYSNLDFNIIKLDSLVDKVIAMFPSAESLIKVTKAIPDKSLFVDETKMKIAFRNIITNALKYGQTNQPIEITCLIIDNQVHFSVRDYGNGISATNIKKITKPFYRIDSGGAIKQGGFGLGLAITKKILEAHHGKLIIESEINKGSIFTLVFPVGS